MGSKTPKTVIKDGVLSCPTAPPELPKLESSFIETLLANLENVLDRTGDRVVILNAALGNS